MAEQIAQQDVDKGLVALAQTMDAGCFAALLTLINWGKTWQAIFDKSINGMDGNHARAMMLFLTGVGADPMTWAKHGPTAMAVLNNEITKWTADAVYRDANSMPWLVLSVVGPALSGSSKGINFGTKAHQIINEHFSAGVMPNVPDLADIVDEFERRRESHESIGAVSELADRAAAPAYPTGTAIPQGPGTQQSQTSQHPNGNSADAFSGLGGNVRRSV